jgi:hypothetical protein
MRLLSVIAFSVLMVWLVRPFFDPAVSGYTGQKHWFYEDSVENRAELERVMAAGHIHEDPERHRLRQAVLDAGSRLQSSPCDPAVKPALVAAVTALLSNMYKTDGEPVEMVTLDGKEIDATTFLNYEAAQVIRDAKNVELLHSEDFSQKKIGDQFPSTPPHIEHRYDHGRFACTGMPGYPSTDR